MVIKNAQSAQRLIYGCMGLGGAWDTSPYGSQDVEQAADVIAAVRSAGITAFDHADIYRWGKAESVFGEVLASSPGLREEISLQTKCGIRLAEGGLPGHYDLSRENILAQVNGSLRRLRTDYVDILLLHRPDPLMDITAVAATLEQLMAEGKVRALGVSNMSAAQISYLQNFLGVPIAANQLEMSLGKRAWVESTVLVNREEDGGAGFPHGTLEHAATAGIELQAYGSLAQGRYALSAATSAKDISPEDVAATEVVSRLAAVHGCTGEAVVLGWLMKHPANISPVIGTSNPDRIAACAPAPRIAAAMTRTEWYELWIAARGCELP